MGKFRSDSHIRAYICPLPIPQGVFQTFEKWPLWARILFQLNSCFPPPVQEPGFSTNKNPPPRCYRLDRGRGASQPLLAYPSEVVGSVYHLPGKQSSEWDAGRIERPPEACLSTSRRGKGVRNNGIGQAAASAEFSTNEKYPLFYFANLGIMYAISQTVLFCNPSGSGLWI